MRYLVFCPCGHSLEAHTDIGCRGAAGRCACEATESLALQNAIDRARYDAHVYWKRPDEQQKAV